MIKKKSNFLFLVLLIILLPLFSFSEASAQGGPGWEDAIDQCTFVDHWWEPSSYPDIDTGSPIFSGSLTLGGFGFTFDLDYVEPGSTWLVNFDDQFQLESVVGEDGKTFVYYGLWSYGEYWYESTFVSPSSETMPGPGGTIVLDDTENLECSPYYLAPYVYPATVTPVPTSTTAPLSTNTPSPETISEEPAVILENKEIIDPIDEDSSFLGSAYNYIVSSWYLLCCCLILIGLILLGIVVIVIRRRRPETYERIRTKFKF